MSGDIAIDDRDWPILRVRWPQVAVSLASLDAFAVDAERFYARRERFAVLIDARGAAPIGARGIARAIAIERRHAPLAAELLTARAIVLDSEVAVRVLDATLAALRPHPRRNLAPHHPPRRRDTHRFRNIAKPLAYSPPAANPP
ncbi:MAG: hypothetical protein M3Y87_10725 [Myxococcota bacterium]|nr:hypothetical protein [Myxococcota bacterium]